MTEEWKYIYSVGTGYEYQVSNLGRVRKIDGYTETIVNQRINKAGYCIVYIGKKLYYVHRLVANCFIENPFSYNVVNHKDENKTNNCVDNLEWCTQWYNCNYGSRNERISKSNKIMNRKLMKPILQFSKNGEFIKEFSSIHEAAQEMNTSHVSISNACNGKSKSSCGFIWKFK